MDIKMIKKNYKQFYAHKTHSMKDTICKNSYSEEINYLNNPLSIKKLSQLSIIQSNNHAP